MEDGPRKGAPAVCSAKGKQVAAECRSHENAPQFSLRTGQRPFLAEGLGFGRNGQK